MYHMIKIYATIFANMFVFLTIILIFRPASDSEPELDSRFSEIKEFHGIEDERPLTGAAGPQKMSSGLLCMIQKFPDQLFETISNVSNLLIVLI